MASQPGVRNISANIDISPHRTLSHQNIDDIIKISEDRLGKNYLLPEDITHPSYRWVLATNNSKVVGFASFTNNSSDAVIADVAVDNNYQGNGIATGIIAQCVFEISILWVEYIECSAWVTNGYPHLEKPLLRNGFVPAYLETRLPTDYRDNFECPVCGLGCKCETLLFKRTTDFSDILNL